MTEGNPVLWTTKQLAERWQVSEAHIYRLTREDAIPHVKLGRYVRYHPVAIDRFERGGMGLDIPDDLMATLQALAARNGLTISRMLEQAITNEKYIEDQLDSGEEILVGHGEHFRKLALV
jgi:excisionase family DNA binding protein